MLNEDFARDLGKRIQDARVDRGITQTALARLIDSSQSSVGYWETGKRGVPMDKIPTLCKALKVTPGYIFGAEPIDGPRRVAEEYNRMRVIILEQEQQIRKLKGQR